ncbi:hypothetical protein DFQ08_10278 [Winogradskyella arenosi]|uniref:Uncharacterized protein n=1 Tax=Winogradskyella arenosi TaxID=533325 RepID=A0A368ZIF4_9FLAO|nr:hypothetical protein DFQ08_10278 [Winogradskyella arenosi]
MKKLLLSLVILAGATLVLSQDDSNDLDNIGADEVVSVQMNLPLDLRH